MPIQSFISRVFKQYFIFFGLFLSTLTSFSQKVKVSVVAQNGWSKNSVNTVVFRKNSLVTFQNVQYVAYYDNESYVVLGKRNGSGKTWTTERTAFKGDAKDAHKSISIAIDGDGILHISWNQHGNGLYYAKSVAPGSLTLGKRQSMVGKNEGNVTYPEFYRFKNGDLLFCYRDGSSGQGNLVLNRYIVSSKTWTRLQDNLIDGQGLRNAYWQLTLDGKDHIHLSWVWRESPNVASNHDLCYAKSEDGGLTWKKSDAKPYSLPINAANAEYVLKIPQGSNLINQTSMCVAEDGKVFIATYFNAPESGFPQYQVIYGEQGIWHVNPLSFRKSGFELGGHGTKKIPISRPQIICWTKSGQIQVGLLFRDSERSNRISIAQTANIVGNRWKIKDLTKKSYGDWEPSFDPILWADQQLLNIFAQYTNQVDGEGMADAAASPIEVVEWQPN